VTPGGTTTFSGAGFEPGAPVTTTLCSTPVSVGTTQADATGAFRIDVVVPAGTALGGHTLVAKGRGPGGSHTSVATVQVAGSATIRFTG
jgi:hypothetical protein